MPISNCQRFNIFIFASPCASIVSIHTFFMITLSWFTFVIKQWLAPDIKIGTCARRYGMPDVGISTRVGFLGCPTLISTCYNFFLHNCHFVQLVHHNDFDYQSSWPVSCHVPSFPTHPTCFQYIFDCFGDKDKSANFLCLRVMSIWRCKQYDKNELKTHSHGWPYHFLRRLYPRLHHVQQQRGSSCTWSPEQGSRRWSASMPRCLRLSDRPLGLRHNRQSRPWRQFCR